LFYTTRNVRGHEYIQETRVYGRHTCSPSFLLRIKHDKYIPSARLALRRNWERICYFSGLFFAQAMNGFWSEDI